MGTVNSIMVEVTLKIDGATMLPSIVDDLPGKNATENILSPQLRANFEALRKLKENNDDSLGLEEESRPCKRRNTQQDLISTETNSDKAFSLALSTYFLIEDEVSHMKNGIAELEALLLQTEAEAEATEHQQTHDFDNSILISDAS